jgi:hypothetical protein
MSKKLALDCDDELWNLVLKFKIDNHLKKNNDAVLMLLKRGLKNESS